MALSGVFNPVESLPGVLQPLARVLPEHAHVAALRDVLDGQPLAVGEIHAGLLGAVVFLVAGFAFSGMLRTFRRRGFVTRFS